MPALFRSVMSARRGRFSVAAPPGGVDDPTFRYVRQGASGSATGLDWTNAYTTLPATLTRGCTYFIADGSYAGYTFDDAVSGTTLIDVKKATVADHGTATGWADAYGDGQATFSGQLAVTTNYWRINGQTGGGAAEGWVGAFGFKVTETGDGNAVLRIPANNVSISHIDLQGKGSVSTSGGSASNDGLDCRGTNVTLSYYRMTGIGRCPFFISPRSLVVEHGWVVSYFGSVGVHSEVASIWAFAQSVGDVTFRHNLFTDIKSTGGIMWDNSSNNAAVCAVYGNVFYRPSGATWEQANGVIGGWTGGGGEECRNLLVYNNTFINVDQESLSTLPNIFSGNVASNNLFYNCDSPSFDIYSGHNYNHFINSGGAHSEANGTTAASGDPFVDYVNRDFRLASATAAGTTLSAPYNLDSLGNTRGADGVWDRGAFEKTA